MVEKLNESNEIHPAPQEDEDQDQSARAILLPDINAKSNVVFNENVEDEENKAEIMGQDNIPQDVQEDEEVKGGETERAQIPDEDAKEAIGFGEETTPANIGKENDDKVIKNLTMTKSILDGIVVHEKGKDK